MNQVIRESTYRGSIVAHAVSLSSGDFPQWVAELVATEIWDDEEKIWVNFTSPEYVEEGNGAIAYLVLFGGDGKETLNAKQVQKVTGWDGLSFEGLNDMDLSSTGIQFRMKSNTYKEKTRLQVDWIDEYDATPGVGVPTLNPDQLKQLDAKYKQFMKRTAPAQAPTKAPTTKPKSPGKVTAKGIKPTQAKGPVKKKETPGKSEPPTEAPSIPDDLGKGKPEIGKTTKAEAWETVVKMKTDKISDEKLAKVWLAVVEKVSAGGDSNTLTEEQWYEVEEAVLDKVAKF